MKRNIIAYLYPKPEEVDEYLRRHDFDARCHTSPDDTEAHVPSMNDGIARASKHLLAISLRDPDRYIPDNPHEFVWFSHNGSRRRISEMASPHIFYSLRMIFNHSVPPAFRVLRPGETMNRYSDVPHWTPAYRQAAVNAFTRELCSRDDLEPELQAQFDDMKANTQLILTLGL